MGSAEGRQPLCVPFPFPLKRKSGECRGASAPLRAFPLSPEKEKWGVQRGVSPSALPTFPLPPQAV
ncbi:hypothetical protein KSC_052060 [Ktedonobacter sp. SOSP1-52]|nr:hypothetical protein KSC_052060 [Ktedonobacter sp. SOSP1-52]